MKNAAPVQALSDRGRSVAQDDEPGNNAAYEEYLRGFDDVPVLQDVVRIPPPRPKQPDFRRGERRDVRQEPRADSYSAREATLAELASLYSEYTQPAPVASQPKRKKRQPSKRKTTRKSASARKSKAKSKQY